LAEYASTLFISLLFCIIFLGSDLVHGTATYRRDDTRGCMIQF
jgi:hypothetical protein